MKLFHYLILLLLLMSFVSSFIACEIEQPIRLSAADKKIIDTMYMERAANLRKELDSICVLQYDSLIQLEVDSILEIRLEEIARQRQRFEQRQQKKAQ